MTTSGPISRAVSEALRAAETPTTDKAAVALARRYASLIDNAAPSKAYAEALRVVGAWLDVNTPDTLEKHWRVITVALAEHTVASDLGPKLLAVLTALGMTTAGRPAKSGGDPVAPTVPGALDELREARKRRQQQSAGSD